MKKYMRLAAAAFVLAAMGMMSVGVKAKPAKAYDAITGEAFLPLFPLPDGDGGCACLGVNQRSGVATFKP